MNCDFFDCSEIACENDQHLKRSESLRLCKEHSQEIDGYIGEWDIPKIMDFWVRSHGGAERMAHGITGQIT